MPKPKRNYNPAQPLDPLKKIIDDRVTIEDQIEKGIIRSVGPANLLKIEIPSGSGHYYDVQGSAELTYGVGQQAQVMRGVDGKWTIFNAYSSGKGVVTTNTVSGVTALDSPVRPANLEGLAGIGFVAFQWTAQNSKTPIQYEVAIGSELINDTSNPDIFFVSGTCFIVTTNVSVPTNVYCRVRGVNGNGARSEWCDQIAVTSLALPGTTSTGTKTVKFSASASMTVDTVNVVGHRHSQPFAFDTEVTNDEGAGDTFLNGVGNLGGTDDPADTHNYFKFTAPVDGPYTFRLHGTSSYNYSTIPTIYNARIRAYPYPTSGIWANIGTIFSKTLSSGTSTVSSETIDSSLTINLTAGQVVMITQEISDYNFNTGSIWVMASGSYIEVTWEGAFSGNTQKYILQQPDDSLPNAQALSELDTGILKSTTATGIVSIAGDVDILAAHGHQAPNTFPAGPASPMHIDADPTWRNIVNDDLPVVDAAHGGTGTNTNTEGGLMIGHGTSPVTSLVGSSVGDNPTWNGTTWISSAPGGGGGGTLVQQNINGLDGDVAIDPTTDIVHIKDQSDAVRLILPSSGDILEHKQIRFYSDSGSMAAAMALGISIAPSSGDVIQPYALDSTSYVGMNWEVILPGLTPTYYSAISATIEYVGNGEWVVVDGSILNYGSSYVWTNVKPVSEGGLGDIRSDIVDGAIYRYNDTTGFKRFESVIGSTDGDVLTWNATGGKWEAQAPTGGGGGGSLTIEDTNGDLSDTYTYLRFPATTLKSELAGEITYRENDRINNPPDTPSAYNDEFNGSSLDGKWSVYNSNSHSVITVEDGCLVVRVTQDGRATDPGTWRGIYQNLPTTPYDVRAKFYFDGLDTSDRAVIALALQDSSTNKRVMLELANAFYWGHVNASLGTDVYGSISYPVDALREFYFRIKDDGTYRTFYISLNGIIWYQMNQEASGSYCVPDKLYIYWITDWMYSRRNYTFAVDWVRVS